MPSNDDTYEVQNEKLLLLKPDLTMVGDYVCKLVGDSKELAVISVRAPPYIDDFDIGTSHTGRSSTINDGDRLELTCQVRNRGTGPVKITWLRSANPDDEHTVVALNEVTPEQAGADGGTLGADTILVESLGAASKRLVIEQVKPEHRSYYVCLADNGVTERARKVIYIRVKDKLVALWPFLGIVAELFILFTIIYVWETRRALRELLPAAQAAQAELAADKAPASERLLQPTGNRWQ